jgi:ATP-binding cassette, subfamily F, member 3
MLSVNNLTIRFSGEAIFENISFMVKPKDRIGLTGKNGAGKTTLLRIINDEIPSSEGTVSKPKDCKIAYLPQHIAFYDKGISVLNELRTAFPEILEIEAKSLKLNNALVNRTDYESESYQKLIQDISEIAERSALLNADSINGEIEKTIKGLGFKTSDIHRNTAEFSGGWRMRIELAKLLLSKPNVLMLDEPTNHLDIESIEWVEEFLVNYPGAVVLISHDRQFLDTVTERTIELELGKLYDYPASYSQYETMRQERITQQKAAYENQQKKLEETENFVERFRYKSTKAKQVQSRIKQLDKAERIEIEQTDISKIHFRFPPAPRAGTIVLESINLQKSYGNHLVLNKINFTLERGEKVAFIGKNGEGKTTFARILNGELSFNAGELKTGHNLSIGYYAQNQDEMLDNQRTVFQNLDDIAVGDVRKNIRGILGSFMFSGEDIDKKVSVLSGGERSRLALAKLLLKPHNLLILDEPTNHLDIHSKDVLKQALQEYDGSLIIVSHDRYFLDGLCDTVYEFRNQNIKQHLGGISRFLEYRKLENMRELNSNTSKSQNQKSKTSLSSKNEYLARKELTKQIRKVEKEIEKAEHEISLIENKLSEIESILSKPELADSSHYDEYDKLNKSLIHWMEIWDEQHKSLNLLSQE